MMDPFLHSFLHSFFSHQVLVSPMNSHNIFSGKTNTYGVFGSQMSLCPPMPSMGIRFLPYGGTEWLQTQFAHEETNSWGKFSAEQGDNLLSETASYSSSHRTGLSVVPPHNCSPPLAMETKATFIIF